MQVSHSTLQSAMCSVFQDYQADSFGGCSPIQSAAIFLN